MPLDDEENDLDELVIEFAEPLSERVSEGPHEATVAGIRRMRLERWKRECLIVKFKIVEVGLAHNVMLCGYVNLGSAEQGDPKKKAKRPSPASKLGRWWRIIADSTGGSRSKVSLQAFKQFLFTINVTNVKIDNRGQGISDAAQGQIVSEITGIVAKLGTEQSTAHKQAHMAQDKRSSTTQTTGFPPFIPGLGPLKKDVVRKCEGCDALTSFSYATRPFCPVHARQLAEGAE